MLHKNETPTASKMPSLWQKLGLADGISAAYEQHRTERSESALADSSRKLAEKRLKQQL
jgi:hypothetical protein